MWALRLGVAVLTVGWVVRSYRKERLFVAQAQAQAARAAPRPGTGAAPGGARQERLVGSWAPGEQRAVAEPNATL